MGWPQLADGRVLVRVLGDDGSRRRGRRASSGAKGAWARGAHLSLALVPRARTSMDELPRDFSFNAPMAPAPTASASAAARRWTRRWWCPTRRCR
ncbi:MAG: hypothetical protein ACLUVF_11655 [Adlercreutzia sp.]